MSSKRFRDPEEAFAARTVRRGECLIWTGAADKHGYGRMSVNGKLMLSHRYAWERENGPLSVEELVDHHVCYTPACVEITHLRVATHAQNEQNRRGPEVISSTGFRNVYRNGSGFSVQIETGGKSHYYGTYRTKEEAAAVAESARRELFGEFAGRG